MWQPSFLLLAPILSVASANMIKRPASHKRTTVSEDECSLIKLNSNFDDEHFAPVLPLVNPISEYQGLKYSNFAGVNTDTFGADLNFLEPFSKPNVIVTGFEQTFLSGGGSQASLTTKYDGAPRPYFNFHDLTLACFANDVGSVANIPVTCDVTFRSYHNVSVLLTVPSTKPS